jgi:hypothetical protein
MIENTEKVDTCQLEIQKRWTPVEGAPINRPEERTIFWCFALKFLDRERCCSAYPQAESSVAAMGWRGAVFTDRTRGVLRN